jgi:hypothetical protein
MGLRGFTHEGGLMKSYVYELAARNRAVAQAAEERERAMAEAGRRGFHRIDYQDAGCTDYQVRGWERYTPHITPAFAALVGGDPSHQLADDDVIAIVASSKDTAQRLLTDYSVYLRDRNLEQPVRHIAAAIATDTDVQIPYAQPILARYLLGSASAQPSHTDPDIDNALRRCLPDPEVRRVWNGPCDVFVLGQPVTIGLPLGFSGRGGIPGTRHHLLADLRDATVLKGLPNVPAGFAAL